MDLLAWTAICEIITFWAKLDPLASQAALKGSECNRVALRALRRGLYNWENLTYNK